MGRVLILSAVLGLVLSASAAWAGPVTVRVLESNSESIRIQYRVNDYVMEPVEINEQVYQRITMGKEF